MAIVGYSLATVHKSHKEDLVFATEQLRAASTRGAYALIAANWALIGVDFIDGTIPLALLSFSILVAVASLGLELWSREAYLKGVEALLEQCEKIADGDSGPSYQAYQIKVFNLFGAAGRRKESIRIQPLAIGALLTFNALITGISFSG